MFRPASRGLVVRRRSSFSRSVVASPPLLELVVVGSRLFKLRARLGSRCRLGKPRRNRLTPRPSGRLRRRLTQALELQCTN